MPSKKGHNLAGWSDGRLDFIHPGLPRAPHRMPNWEDDPKNHEGPSQLERRAALTNFCNTCQKGQHCCHPCYACPCCTVNRGVPAVRAQIERTCRASAKIAPTHLTPWAGCRGVPRLLAVHLASFAVCFVLAGLGYADGGPFAGRYFLLDGIAGALLA